jgi:hypothetical protein
MLSLLLLLLLLLVVEGLLIEPLEGLLELAAGLVRPGRRYAIKRILLLLKKLIGDYYCTLQLLLLSSLSPYFLL